MEDSHVTGLGVDIIEVERIEAVLERSPRFVERTYTEAERAYCEQRHRPAVHFATHFAAKEAVLKALGTGFAEGIGCKDVEVGHDERGRPVALLHGRAAEVAEQQGVLEIHLSLSRTHGTAVANAIAVTEGMRVQPKGDDAPSPREELAAAFKELRGMLDGMEEELASSARADDGPCEDAGGAPDA